MTSPWTDDRIARAKQLYIVEGRSAAETAKALGQTTRNAVIGIAHRRGWLKDHRQAPAAVSTRRAPAVKPTVHKPPKPGPQLKPAVIHGKAAPVVSAKEARAKAEEYARAGKAIVEAFPKVAGPDAVRLIDRRFGQCSWPANEPDRPADLMCCGRPVPEGQNKGVQTYCDDHALIAVNRTRLGGQPDAKAYERSLRRAFA